MRSRFFLNFCLISFSDNDLSLRELTCPTGVSVDHILEPNISFRQNLCCLYLYRPFLYSVFFQKLRKNLNFSQHFFTKARFRMNWCFSLVSFLYRSFGREKRRFVIYFIGGGSKRLEFFLVTFTYSIPWNMYCMYVGR